MAGEQASSLLDKLGRELNEKKLADAERAKLLEQLKVIGRNPAQAKPIFEKDNTSILCRYAFDTGACASSREAMRCLANAMLLNEPTRQTVLDLGYSGKVAERMSVDDRDDEFLTTRILFFASYTTKLDVMALIQKHDLVTSLRKNLERAVQRLDTKTGDTSPITGMAFQETLKLIPNLVYYTPESLADLSPLLEPLATLLVKTPLPSPPLQPPTTHLINALLNVSPEPSKIEDLTLRDPLYPSSNPTALTAHLITIVGTSMPAQITQADDILLSPILSLLRTLHTAAPDTEVRKSIRTALLPTTASREQPLGKDGSLPSRLLRAATSPSTTATKDVISALLYEMSDEDGPTLVSNIGYGYAVGILARLGKEVDPTALGEGGVDGGTDAAGGTATGSRATAAGGADVNPVTGQRLDAEVQAQLEEMTEEEKEREAERLFVLFERLKATGVMDVMNPVEAAMRAGQFEDK